MYLSPSVKKRYTQETFSAYEAQRMAEFVAWSPVVFQVSRLMLKYGILNQLRNKRGGLTLQEIHQGLEETVPALSLYALKILLEGSLSIGTVLIDDKTNKFQLSKMGYFLLTDQATRANIDFNHDVNYRGLFYLDDALEQGRPAGLKILGKWATIYEGLSQLDKQVQKSWFGFDHFYSDHSFTTALELLFRRSPKKLMDVGGNTGRFALRCVDYDSEVEVTIVDLPGQIAMMKDQVSGCVGAERIHSFGTNLLHPQNMLPQDKWDVIWMSQFLDCFSEEEIFQILSKTAAVMNDDTTLYVMETFWDRQKYETASFALTMTSVYFTVMANGNSKMYHSDDFFEQIRRAGLQVVNIYDNIGQGHTILEIKK